MRCARRELEELSAALGVQLRLDRDRLDQRRLAAAVLTHEKRDARVELEPFDAAQRRQLVRVVAGAFLEADRPHERGGRRGRAHTVIMPRYAHGMLSQIIAVIFTAFFTGALARFAVPGPDPMPAWLTILIGLVGTMIGWGIVVAVSG